MLSTKERKKAAINRKQGGESGKDSVKNSRI